MKDVTIIIPAHIRDEEQVQWLRECIDSALDTGQEVILFDDASPVNIDKLAWDYPLVQWINTTENYGVSYARNRAIQEAGTRFIFPLDADDIVRPDALHKMLKAWKGVPIYPDVEKFGDVVVSHFQIKDFSCDDILKHVGMTSVNVLHTKEQWRLIGGYDTSLVFYEDGEYNARLMTRFCGQRYPEPLIRYRIHAKQRTKVYINEEQVHARRVLDKIWRLDDMACCGGKRKASKSPINGGSGSEAMMMLNQPTQNKVSTKVTFESGDLDMPLQMGELILARYFGGEGKAKHNHRGHVSGRSYPRVKYGSLVYADPRDTRKKDEQGTSPLIRVEVVGGVKEKEAKPVKSVTREPTKFDGDREPEDVVDIQTMTIDQIKNLDVTEDQAIALLQQEKAGRNRVGAVRYLESMISEE